MNNQQELSWDAARLPASSKKPYSEQLKPPAFHLSETPFDGNFLRRFRRRLHQWGIDKTYRIWCYAALNGISLRLRGRQLPVELDPLDRRELESCITQLDARFQHEVMNASALGDPILRMLGNLRKQQVQYRYALSESTYQWIRFFLIAGYECPEPVAFWLRDMRERMAVTHKDGEFLYQISEQLLDGQYTDHREEFRNFLKWWYRSLPRERHLMLSIHAHIHGIAQRIPTDGSLSFWAYSSFFAGYRAVREDADQLSQLLSEQIRVLGADHAVFLDQLFRGAFQSNSFDPETVVLRAFHYLKQTGPAISLAKSSPQSARLHELIQRRILMDFCVWAGFFIARPEVFEEFAKYPFPKSGAKLN